MLSTVREDRDEKSKLIRVRFEPGLTNCGWRGVTSAGAASLGSVTSLEQLSELSVDEHAVIGPPKRLTDGHSFAQ